MRNTKSSSRSKASKSKGSVLRRVQNFSLTQLLIFIVVFGAIGGYVIYRSLAAAPAKPGSTMSWNQYFGNIATSMDTPEPSGQFPINRTSCAWNDEDQIERLGTGDLSGSTSDSMCLVADYAFGHGAFPKTAIFKIYSPTDTLSVSLSNDAGSSWSSPPAVKSGHQYLYQLCVVDPVSTKAAIQYGNTAALQSYWPQIPNSNGGYGQIVNYKLSLTSLKGTTHKISADWELGINGGSANTFDVPDIQQSSPVPCPS